MKFSSFWMKYQILGELTLSRYLMLSTPVVALFFLIPFELYYNGREYWNWNHRLPLTFALAGLSCYALVVSLAWVIGRIEERARNTFAAIGFWAGIYFLCADVFAPLQASPLRDTGLTGSEPLLFTLIEGGLLFLILILAIRMGIRSLPLIAFPISIILILISGVYLGLILASSPPPARLPQKYPTNPNLKGNVYHIVLDEMQSDAALLHIREGKVEKFFRGFTLFKNNTSNYLWTFESFHSYMTGTLFRGMSYEEWVNRYRTGGLLRALADKGYNIAMYTPAFYDFRTDLVSEAYTLEESAAQKIKSKYLFFKDFVQIWFARIMPNSCTEAALVRGRRIAQGIQFLLPEEKDSISYPSSIPEGLQPYSSVLMLKELIRAEKHRDPRGQYLYVHALLPRGPYVMDEKGEYDPGPDKLMPHRYYTQVECAFHLVTEFLEELKRLGRYDDSTIILHSDHGTPHGFIKVEGGKVIGAADAKGYDPKNIFLNHPLGLSEEAVRGRILSLLMIKPPHRSGTLMVSERPSQLVDIYPTLIDLLELDPKNEKLDGYALFGKNFPSDRESSFFLTPHGEDRPSDVIRVKIDNPLNPFTSKLIEQGSIHKRPTLFLPAEGLSFEFGGEEERLWLVGFADKEREGEPDPLRFRWSLGRRSRIVFRGVQLPKEKRLSVEFEVEPSPENQNEEMVLKSKRYSAKVVLKPGWSKYVVSLEFPGNEDLELDVECKQAVSRSALGLDPNDGREIAVRWRKVGLFHPLEVPAQGISFGIGIPDEGNLWLSGFADKEQEGKENPLYFRWAMGKQGRIHFRRLHLPAPERLLVELEVEPFAINQNQEMVLKSKNSTAKIQLKPGWSTYFVDLEFPGKEDLVLDLEYKRSASPRSLGLDPNDPRELAVRWKKVSLSHLLYLEPGRPAFFRFGIPDEGKLLLEGFADKEREGEVNPLYFRWGVGKKSRIVFQGLRLKSPQRLSVEFEAEPFIVNQNQEMVLRSKLSCTRVTLRPGWSKYSVDLDFPGKEDLALEVESSAAVSPRALGLDPNDPRDLSARWKSIRFSFPGTPLLEGK